MPKLTTPVLPSINFDALQRVSGGCRKRCAPAPVQQQQQQTMIYAPRFYMPQFYMPQYAPQMAQSAPRRSRFAFDSSVQISGY